VNLVALRGLGAVLVSMTALVAACGGGADDSGFTSNPNDPKFGGTPGAGDSDAGIKTGGTPADLGKCATASATPKPIPVNLVFQFDRSGSMSQSSKWTACAQGLQAFFSDPKSAGLNASLSFFPQGTSCGVGNFTTPAVTSRALPDAVAFQTAIAATGPNGGTPTLPAEQGAIAYAQQLAQQNVGTKTAIVLVTDGEPNDCSSSATSVAAAAATVATTIPTYVVGVGNVANLNAIAVGGGTKQATIVNTNNATQTAQDFQKVLEAIRGLTLACEYAIPPAPAGQTFAKDNVNVVFTPTNSGPSTLSYNADCTGGTGWHYDNAAAPTKIMLCANSCSDVQADKSGKVDIVFGCATQGNLPK
jgi:uncharacterized protein YegL